MRVRRTLRFCKHIVNTYRLKYGTHSTTCLHSCTRSRRLHKYASTAKFSLLLVRNGLLLQRNLYKILLCILNTLRYCCGNLISLTKTISYNAFLIAYNNYCGKTEVASALCYLCNSSYCYKSIFQLNVSSLYLLILDICHSQLEFKTTLASGIS